MSASEKDREAVLEERFWSSIVTVDSCWHWTGSLGVGGYGRIWVGMNGKRFAKAHRYAYELLRGPIPSGMCLDHLCRNRDCVNPDHLEPVDDRTNILRGVSLAAQNHRKTVCKHGHEFTPENTMIEPSGDRQCRTCKRATQRRWRAKAKAAALRAKADAEAHHE